MRWWVVGVSYASNCWIEVGSVCEELKSVRSVEKLKVVCVCVCVCVWG